MKNSRKIIRFTFISALCTRMISSQETPSQHTLTNFTDLLPFPASFTFAAASASYQVEGAWNEDGKGENIWDRLTHTHPQFITNGSNGDVACDSYRKYKEDVSLLKDIGFDVYRFSISWARILPTGDITNINEAGIQYYEKLIDELLKNGIIPMVTMYHWDMPQRLQDIGGWMNPLIADYCEDYADILFKRLGNKVRWWITINEPITIIMGYESINFAPSLHLDSPANYIVGHNILRAHGRIYRLYEKKYKKSQRGKISIALSGPTFLPKTNSTADIEAANRAMLFTFGWFANPIYSKNGDYPEIMRHTIDKNSKIEGRNRSRLPRFTPDEIESIKGSSDFFTTNHYVTFLCSPGNFSSPYSTTYEKDIHVIKEFDPSWLPSCSPWLKVSPEGFRKFFQWIKNEYENVPVFITENGFCDFGEIDDVGRVSYFQAYLKQLLLAIKEDGCNIIGYTVWSIIDNFEWLDGYDRRYGIVHVDFEDEERKRTPKRSALFFKNLLKTKILPQI